MAICFIIIFWILYCTMWLSPHMTKLLPFTLCIPGQSCRLWCKLQGWAFYNSKSSIPNGSASPFGRSWLYTSRHRETVKRLKTVEHLEPVEHLKSVNYHKTVKIAVAHPRAIPLQPCTPALAFSTVATLESPIQPSLQRPEAWSIASFEGRLFALYEERHTLSFSNPFLLGFDADVACSGQVLGRTLVLSMIRAINQQCQYANALPRPRRHTPLHAPKAWDLW